MYASTLARGNLILIDTDSKSPFGITNHMYKNNLYEESHVLIDSRPGIPKIFKKTRRIAPLVKSEIDKEQL